MKTTTKLLLAAAIAGAITARPALADDNGMTSTNTPPSMDKNGCKSKSSCNGKDASSQTNSASKASCNSKDGCKSKDSQGK